MPNSIPRIMIAARHEDMRRIVRFLSEARPNFQIVAEGTNGRECCDLALLTKPDIAIIDFSLPGINGLELAYKLKGHQSKIAIVMYTANLCNVTIEDALKAGIRGFVLKSNTELDVISAMNALSVGKPYFPGLVSEAILQKFMDSKSKHRRNYVTQREREIIQLVAEGRTNMEIGSIMDISPKTVETHRASFMHKLNMRTAADVVRYAVRSNIIVA